MDVADVLLLASSWLYLGFQWTIRVVVYPQLRAVPATAFTRYETAHQRLTSIAVGPLFAVFAAATVFSVVSDTDVATVTAIGCFGLVLAVTAFLAVPQHRRLTRAFDEVAYRRLLAADSVRLGLAALAAAAATVQAVMR